MSDAKGLPEEYYPGNYIERVSLETGEPLDDPIRPEQLLVNNHRDYHIVDVHAHYMMGRVMKATGDEEWAYEKMKRVAWDVADRVFLALKNTEHRDAVRLGVRTLERELEVRKPDTATVARAKEILARPDDVEPRHRREIVYAHRVAGIGGRPGESAERRTTSRMLTLYVSK